MTDTTRVFALLLAGLLGMQLAASAAAGEAERLAAEQATHTLYEAEQYVDALDAVTLLIEYTTDEFGEDAAQLVDPMISLGDIQQRLQQYPRAIESYERAAMLIEINDGIFSDRLVGLLRRIGRAYSAWEHEDEAAAALQRAKVITHRNYGIMNLEQIPIIEDLTAVYAERRDFLSANREQLFALRVSERRFGADSPALVPALYRLAEWYGRTRQWTPARDLYRRAVTILEAAYGGSDVRLVPALTGIADSYRGDRTLRGEGRDALERAVQTYDSAENADVADHGAALISLGDWYLMTGDREEAIEIYRRAWRIMSEGEGGSPELAQKRLGLPKRLRYDPPPPESEHGAGLGGKSEQAVEVAFTILPDGSVDDIVVVESSAPNRVARHVKLAVGQARYRPAFVDGTPVPRHARIRQSYYPDERGRGPAEPSLPAKGAAPSESRPAPEPAEATAAPAEPAPETP